MSKSVGSRDNGDRKGWSKKYKDGKKKDLEMRELEIIKKDYEVLIYDDSVWARNLVGWT